MSERLVTRRELGGLCAAFGSLAAASRVSALDGPAATSAGTPRTVKFPDGAIVPALGQGSARLSKGKRPAAEEEDALRAGLSLGMTLIDTAELYGSEELIGRAIKNQRERVFLVSKVWPTHVEGNGIVRACEASLARLGTDHLDLYLLHWPNRPSPERRWRLVVWRNIGLQQVHGSSEFSQHHVRSDARGCGMAT